MAGSKSFVMKFAAIVLLMVALIFALNATIDPLWYFKGNRWSGVNYSFNERESKLNLYLKSPRAYDCFIFGASAATLLDASLIKNHQCFNFSFGAGSVFDFIDYAKYIRSLHIEPTLIIVDIDFFDFKARQLHSKAPDYIKSGAPPPPVLNTYLSWDVLLLSLKTILGQAPRPPSYNKNFTGFILADQDSPKWQKIADLGQTILYNTSAPMTDRHVEDYRRLRQIFRNAEYVGYVPHTSAAVMAKIEFAGQLENTLDVIYKVSRIFDRFFDFSVPSLDTVNSSDTYDGYHFDPRTTRHVADAINGKNGAALPLHAMSFADYHAAYTKQLDEFIASRNLTKNSFPSDKNNLIDQEP